MFEKQSKDDTDYKRGNPSRIAKYGKENAFLKRDETDGSRSKMETDTRLTGHFLDEKNNAEIGVCDFDNSEESCPVSQESFSIEQIASDTLLHRLDEPGLANEQEKEPEVYSEDEEASSLSSPSVASSLSDVENPSAIVSASDQSENTKKTRDDTITAHILEPLEPGKKKTDFRSQLKKTGLSPRLNLSSSGKISSLTKKEQSEKVDLRKNLKSVPGSGSFTRWGSWSEKYGPSLRERPSKRVEEEPPKRRISSAELFDLVRKRDEPKPAEEKQRKTSLPYKYEPPKIVEPEDQSFDSLMAQRKKSSSRQFSPTDLRKSPTKYAPAWSPKQLRKPTYVPPLPGAARKLSAGSIGNIGSEGSDKKDGVPDEDIDKILKEINVENLEVEETKPVSRPKRKTSSGNIKWVQGPQINIQDKSQLSALRQQIEHEKKEKEGGVSTTTTKTTEIRRDGGGTTFTKTTSTTTTRGASGGISGRGGLRNFEAEMAKKKKERQAAKAQQFKSTKDKRNAFKDQLEAANPKPAGGVKKSFSQPNTAVNALLEWCRRKTRGYENVEIQNYTTSWADGLAMCALFHNFSPDLVPWESLDPKDRKRNWTLAFDAAYAEGMDPLLELEDVLCTPVPEPRSLITYIHSIYQHFHDKAEKAKAEKQQSG